MLPGPPFDGSGQPLPIAWSPDARHLYVINNQGRDVDALVLLDTVTGTSRLVEQPAHDILCADISADGRCLA